MKREPSLSLLLWVVAAGFFMQALDTTIVNTALPAMARSLGESPLRMQSVVIGYSLTMALFIPASGWIADRFGIRRVFLAAIAVFSLGSLLCALSQALWQLVAARVLQGAGGALLMPVGRLAVLRQVPRERFLAAMSFVTIPGLVGPLIGPTLGGWLTEAASWHWVFLINLPVGLIGAFAAARAMPSGRLAESPPFDLSGFGLLAVSMVTISIALDGLGEMGMRRATVLILLFMGLASLAGYWLHAARKAQPLFALSLFETNTFSVGLIGNLFARIGAGSMPFLIPLLLQVSLGYTPMQSGMMMIPTALAAIAAKRVAAGVIGRWGYRRVLVGNTLMVGAMIASFGLFSPEQPMWLRLVQLTVFGAVNSMQFSAMNTITLLDLRQEQKSSGNSLLSMVMMLSMSLGVAVAGALLAAFGDEYGAHDAAAAGGVAAGAGDTELAGAAVAAHSVATAAGHTLDAFHATFVCVGVITCASAWVFAQLAPVARDRVRGGEDASEPG
ncbi:multidrug transporter subunit MdtD [Derxia gummosa]|uniref:Multidrug transporter subunit MdtD n=1 Tax=Derxia gummosa DSM 723 TaxID=1121388 RepID=A0A8B6X933_9BURK|nr:multidrug transporter subunit MdtD [Derxia gummosa]